MISLLEGKKYIFYPAEQEIPKGLIYLDFIKDLIKKPNRYKKMKSFKEYVKCPLNKQCDIEVFEENDTNFNYPELH